MQRLAMLFASGAAVLLVIGLSARRFGLPNLSVAWHGRGYLLGNDFLCYGLAVCFGLFAFLYSAWMIPWSSSAAGWHFGLSVLCVVLFAGSLLFGPSLSGTETRATLFAMMIFTLSPLLFLLVQGWFLIDALRRSLLFFGRV